MMQVQKRTSVVEKSIPELPEEGSNGGDGDGEGVVLKAADATRSKC